MERWKEVFVGKIPKEVYQIKMINGEEQGLVINLSGNHICVIINFGIVQAVQMLDEGIVQCDLYSEDEIRRYKDDNFKNVIYEVEGGEFKKRINNISNGYGEILNLKHYIVITHNYNIDVITEWEPTIEIVKI